MTTPLEEYKASAKARALIHKYVKFHNCHTLVKEEPPYNYWQKGSKYVWPTIDFTDDKDLKLKYLQALHAVRDSVNTYRRHAKQYTFPNMMYKLESECSGALRNVIERIRPSLNKKGRRIIFVKDSREADATEDHDGKTYITISLSWKASVFDRIYKPTMVEQRYTSGKRGRTKKINIDEKQIGDLILRARLIGTTLGEIELYQVLLCKFTSTGIVKTETKYAQSISYGDFAFGNSIPKLIDQVKTSIAPKTIKTMQEQAYADDD